MPKYIIEVLDEEGEWREISNPDSLRAAFEEITELEKAGSHRAIRLGINRDGQILK